MRIAVARYYAGGDPLGARGDFVTAPEITQVFGELIGLWCAATLPDAQLLVELGPGRGTMMRDALRAAKIVPSFRPKLHLVETSPALRAAQRDLPAVWHDSLASVPPGRAIFLANEFFDALPVHQYVGETERRVALMDGDLRFIPDGEAVERSPERAALAAELAHRIAEHGGAALIVDSGYCEGAGDTLQAMRAHRRRDVLDDPGSADLTAHVDFTALAEAARAAGARPWGPNSQRDFLTRLGIETRAAKLIEGATPDQAVSIRSGCRRLIDPREMGTLFQVLSITRNQDPPPAGFEP
jgi:NADH dehydrogenase [ubiquinone] 1 alpha subcomplex assembly factor 7